MFNRLRWGKVVLSPEKCSFFTKKCEFLGLTLLPHGVTPDRDRISAVMQLEPPTDLKELCGFLGSAGHYSMGAIRYWSSLSQPLFSLANNTARAARVKISGSKRATTRIPTKRIPLEWLPIHQKAFEAIKKSLSSAPILSYPDNSRPFLVECDASEWQTGSVLSQPSPTGPNVIAYFSQRFTGSELQYPVYKKECLGVVRSLKHWKHYLLGHRILIVTDAKSIVALYASNDVTGILSRLWNTLMRYNVWLVHRPVAKMTGADFFSRHPRKETLEFPLPIVDSYEAACKIPLGARVKTRKAARTVLDELQTADNLVAAKVDTDLGPEITDIESYGMERHEGDTAGCTPLHGGSVERQAHRKRVHRSRQPRQA